MSAEIVSQFLTVLSFAGTLALLLLFLTLLLLVFVLLCETISHCVAQPSLELMTFPPEPSKCWDYSRV